MEIIDKYPDKPWVKGNGHQEIEIYQLIYT